MNYIAPSFTLFSTLILLFSIKPTLSICGKNNHKGWRTIAMFLILFIFGAVTYTILLLLLPFSPLELFIAPIFAIGSLFTLLVMHLSLKSINQYQTTAMNERFNAQHDALTGLKNRQFMWQNLKLKTQNKQHFALMLIDLDNFKQVNDAFGHLAGDALLKAMAMRIQLIFNKKNTINNNTQLIRLGGDEFAIILDYTQKSEVTDCIQLLQGILKKPFFIRGTMVHIQMSIGIACYPEHSCSITELIKSADAAMYKAKKQASGFCFYSIDYERSSKQHIQLNDKIRNALAKNEFSLHYQPIFENDGQTIYSFETLIRWQQQDGSYISPALFIPVAEKAGLVSSITQWVIHAAFTQLEMWQDSGHYRRLQINFSACDLQNDGIVDYLKEQLDTFNINPNQVILEITESAMIADITLAKNALRKLHALGITLSVDDFGSGYTSLTMLSDMPIKQIKIDSQYVIEMSRKNNNFAIISSIAFLANSIGAKVVIEGIENRKVLTKVSTLENTLLQGHFFGQPMNAEQLEQMFSSTIKMMSLQS
jgi:diguanylate cyclase